MGLAYQEFTGRWVTQLEVTADGWASACDHGCAAHGAVQHPRPGVFPYIGDYIRHLAVDDFYGVFRRAGQENDARRVVIE